MTELLDPGMRTPVILVVDDEALLRMLAREHFGAAGYDVIEAASGEEALAVLKARPDVRAVFTDVQMPGNPDGLGLARRVRDMNPDCAIVVVSGHVVPRPSDMAVGARFLPKPYDGEAVVGLIGEMLRT